MIRFLMSKNILSMPVLVLQLIFWSMYAALEFFPQPRKKFTTTFINTVKSITSTSCSNLNTLNHYTITIIIINAYLTISNVKKIMNYL